MIALESVKTDKLYWKQPRAMQRYFELRTGEELIGTLSMPGIASYRAVGHTAGREWSFNRHGIFKPRISITEVSTGIEVAHMTYKWRMQGDIVFNNERRFGWRNTNFWQTKWQMTGANGFPLYELEITKQWFRYEATIHLTPEAQHTDDLPLLALTGWYLAYLMKQDSAAAAAAT